MAGRIVANQHHSQPGRPASTCDKAHDRLADFLANTSSQGDAIKDAGAHATGSGIGEEVAGAGPAGLGRFGAAVGE